MFSYFLSEIGFFPKTRFILASVFKSQDNKTIGDNTGQG